MKHLFLISITFILGCYIGDILKGQTKYQQDIGQAKAVSLKTRYFFVGYRIEAIASATGNLQWFTKDGLMPVKKEVYKFLKEGALKDLAFTYDKLIITGLHEFKNKQDCDQFFNDQK